MDRCLINNNTRFRKNVEENSLDDCEAVYKDEYRSGKCVSCGKLHLRNLCEFSYDKCFNCGQIEHIKLVYNNNVHFATVGYKLCNLDLKNLVILSQKKLLLMVSGQRI